MRITIQLAKIPRIFEPFLQILTFLWFISIWVLSLIKIQAPDNLPAVQWKFIDKYVHFTFYFVLAVLIYMTQTLKLRRKLVQGHRLFIVLGVFLMGFSIEIIQLYFAPAREGEWMDVVANTTGVLAALFTYKLLMKLIKT